MSKISQCHAELVIQCVGHNGLALPDLSCLYYRESRLIPLKCIHRSGKECMNPDAVREAIETLIKNVRLSEP